jgi:hypothetical protein
MTSIENIKLQALPNYLKIIKKSLPKQCTFLGSVRKPTGELYIKYIVNKESFLLTIPEDLNFTKADWDRIISLIQSKCH